MAKRDYSNWTKEELIEEVSKFDKRKKYGLVWEEKTEDVVEQCKTELPVIKELREKRVLSDGGAINNILVEGDNYHVISVLNFTHKGKIDFIYIDPPYNTGARDWKYNNDYVDSEDGFRHSKWISFMSHRLRHCKSLLKSNGVICVTIDDYELSRLLMLMDEIFGENNHLGTIIIRNNPKGRMTNRKASLVHEYAIFYGRSQLSRINNLPVDPSEKTHNYKKNKNGDWYLPVNLRKQGVDSNAVNKKGVTSERYYSIYWDPKSGEVSTQKKLEIEISPIDGRGIKRIWRRSKGVIDEMYKKGQLWAKETANGPQVYFEFKGGLDGKKVQTIWTDPKYSASDHGTRILDDILGEREKFQYPKSPYAVMDSILAGAAGKDALIFDFFAGSGTTGEAIFRLNLEDGGNRSFILCTNNENNICTDVTYPRLKNLLTGYRSARSKKDVEGYVANLRYYQTAFVKAAQTDENKRRLVDESIDMICIKEGCYDQIESSNEYKIFKNNDCYTGILLDTLKFDQFKQRLATLNLPVKVYIFSLTDDDYSDEFEGLVDVTVSPIPAAILKTYRKIFGAKQ